MDVQPPHFNAQSQQPTAGRRSQRQRVLAIIASVLVVVAALSLLTFAFAFWQAARSKANQSTPPAQTTNLAAQPSATSQPTPTPTLIPTPTPTPTPTPASQQLTSQLDNLFTNLTAQQNFSGSVLIMKNGQALLNKGYSMADWTQQVPNSADTRFFLGSVTKEFTATAILLLQERGKLHVQDSPCAYINPCPESWKSVTIHEILTHTSGIPEEDNEGGSTPANWIYGFNNYGLAFTPGSQFSYCSTCYQILAYVAQQASGQAYAQFVRQNIFDPLHMQHTTFDYQYFYAQPDHATGYASWQNPANTLGWVSDETSSWSFLDGSGVLTTTAGDLYLWDQGLDAHKILTQASLDQAYTAFSPTSLFYGSGYGYGWFIGKSPVAGHRLIWHDGVIDGFRTYIGRYIDDNITIIFLSNLATTDSLSIAHSAEHLVFSS